MHILLHILNALKRRDAPRAPRDPLAGLSLREQADIPPWHEPRLAPREDDACTGC